MITLRSQRLLHTQDRPLVSPHSPSSRPCLRVGKSRCCLSKQLGLSSCVKIPPSAHSRSRALSQTTYAASSPTPGPQGAFENGKQSEARQNLFNNIAPVYDQLNDVLSLGLHRVWKRTAVKWSRAQEGDATLDICCGSGDLALQLAAKVGPKGKVIGLDFAASQLKVAADKESQTPGGWLRPSIEWVEGDALELPFEDSSFDAATLGYGLRNVTDIPRCLEELSRVLKPSASVAILDFNRPMDMPTQNLQSFMLDNVVVPVATAAGVPEEYEYLKPSIAAFPTGPEQEKLALEAGFKEAIHYELMGGLMGCLVATNPDMK
mmetsp:Transcript_13132/g.15898  ORF Transcript_13132/g.15898 Transcript_13132/m.15898 type:complete len:320 (+) Transcript_13132:407-1366(+)|eukprot:CAMPEP_0197861618 /NCGR_PEP_ID=MMETSP1438-20131217/37799_1 /TAXON_ID=1461541 /ORGANISM="Pterosperma sp., Strain CCMP1384" /LENGTH=319 /DNA_ID=CAMNT_0043478855 /DNA_START=400 /DNA_END=1359 /DNA_ORIENTATION=+